MSAGWGVNNTALSGEIRFQAGRSKESVAQHPSSFEERVAFTGAADRYIRHVELISKIWREFSLQPAAIIHVTDISALVEVR
ncbi:hypothetical protein L873DRAFT_1806028 [Choiromyces venosus 120613-1]|uniref:Uncharacterized protein n=1 Tax=Choiromyces venosus 120613-1 TaxID=1336337 RepID=A0A3N4JST2_9PEZI|nr:hypothetical protein L873DRAFT_1806028 [Choiromyces venosus 120613-1]